jgi:hypothetical protein
MDIEVIDAGDGFTAVLKITAKESDGFAYAMNVPLGLEDERTLMHTLITRAKARGEHLTL